MPPRMGRRDASPGPGPWSEEGACRTADTDLFFSGDDRDIAAAKRICATCPVLVECRAYARRWNMRGVWGGESESER